MSAGDKGIGGRKMSKANYYMQVIQMSDKEKLKMYMKLPKKELAQMLINTNKLLDNFLPLIRSVSIPRETP